MPESKKDFLIHLGPSPERFPSSFGSTLTDNHKQKINSKQKQKKWFTNNRRLFSTVWEVGKSRIKVPAAPVSGEGPRDASDHRTTHAVTSEGRSVERVYSSFSCVVVYLCVVYASGLGVCECVWCRHTCPHPCTHVPRLEGIVWCPTLALSALFLRDRVCHWTWKQAGKRASPGDAPLLPSQSTGGVDVHGHAQPYTWWLRPSSRPSRCSYSLSHLPDLGFLSLKSTSPVFHASSQEMWANIYTLQ